MNSQNRAHKNAIPAILSLIVAGLVSACGNYTSTTRQARDEFYAGKYTDAAKLLEKGAHEDSVDQLLYLFDRATALHEAGQFDESIKDFAAADKLSEIKDYTSLSHEVATLVTNDKIIAYKGEDFEKVLISQYQALNYLLQHKYEDAMVEARRVNQKLYLMTSQGKKKYRLNPFASYLTALMWEDQKEWNDAYVDYQAVHKLAQDFPYLGEDLWRLAWLNNNREDMDQWAEEYKLSSDDRRRIKQTAKQPEVIVIVENGKSPEKQPNPTWTALPKYYPRFNPVSYAQVFINGTDGGRSFPLFDVEKTAIEDLDQKYAGLIAKRIAGVAAKEVIADQVGKRTDPIVGAILRLGMYAADQADLRSWLTLPRDFQVYRMRVAPAESYTLKVVPMSAAGAATGTPVEKVVTFDPKSKSTQRMFVHVRIL